MGLLVGSLAWQHGAATFGRGTAAQASSDPEDGSATDGNYTNKYFGLSFRPPQGWTEGDAGPDPSDSGYYVLAAFVPDSGPDATILMAAQDMFFGSDVRAGVPARIRDFQQAVSGIDGMTIDREMTESRIAGRAFYRVDYSGVGLFRAAIAAEFRCHVVSFNLTARQPGLLERLVGGLDQLSFGASDPSPPPCVKDYAVGDNILRKVAPVPAGPKFTPIPVRIVVGIDGRVKHVHVIRATVDQRRNIEEALYQWELRPYESAGHPSPVETGLVFSFSGDK